MTSGREAKVHALQAMDEQRRLSKEELLRPRIIEEEQEIESLGGTVVLRSLSHKQRQEIRQQSNFGKPEFDEELFTTLTIIESLVDPKLAAEDIEALRSQSAAVYDDLVMRISFLNLLGKTDDLKKDSSPTKS